MVSNEYLEDYIPFQMIIVYDMCVIIVIVTDM